MRCQLLATMETAKNIQPVNLKQITVQQIGVTVFYSEGITITSSQRIAVRKLITEMGLTVKSGEEAEAITMVLNRLAELAKAAGGDAPLPERPSTDFIEQLQSMSGNEQFVMVYGQRDELLNSFNTWTQARDKIKLRQPQWEMLQKMLFHARNLSVVREVDAQVTAIKESRSLLDDPDPVSPLLHRVATALRGELQKARERLIEAQERELKALTTSKDWQNLAEADRQRMLYQNALGPVSQLKIGTDEELLAALDTTSLAAWEDKIAASPGRVKKVREETAKLLTPKVVRIPIPQVTLQSIEEVDTYLAMMRAEIMKQIEAGNPVMM